MARILLIDDDPLIRGSVRTLLHLGGHTVEAAGGGDAGIEAYRRQRADLVLCDLVMPGKDGLETIRDLQREFPGVKVLAMSGAGSDRGESALEAAEKMGVGGTLRKPFTMVSLVQAIENLLGFVTP